jgi:hypothetical protein
MPVEMQSHHNELSRVAFWLVPQQKVRLELSKVICQLAQTFSSPIFVPHVTLYSCLRTSLQTELGLLAKLAQQTPSLVCQVTEQNVSDRLTQALFVHLSAPPSAYKIYENLHLQVPKPSTYAFDPHLSLLYTHLTLFHQNKLMAKTLVEQREICFDQLWAVAIPDKIEKKNDCVGWQTLLTCRLNPRE